MSSSATAAAVVVAVRRAGSLTVLLLLLLLSTSALCGAWADCPTVCECKWRSGKESAICAMANMTTVPRHLDYGTQLLDLTGNPLYRLGKDAFADADLLNLQKLYLSRCRITALDRHAFRKLNNLVELDLSHNNIPVVPSAVLEFVPELRELRINGNPIMKIPNGAFAHVPRLVKLDVSECRLALLESTAFSGLETSLELLRLDNNQLRDVRPATVMSLTKLQGVRLNDNPWNCSCKLRPLREWMVRRNIPYGGAPPVCKTPARLARTPWDELELDDFSCEPHSIPVSPVVIVTEGDNVTVSCRMFGVPIPSSRWTRNDRPLSRTGHSVPVTEGRYTNLTIVSAVAQDGGSYVCELENRSGSSRANVTVVVMKRSQESTTAADRYALPGLIVGVILVLSFCLIFLCGLAIRTKESPTRYATDCHQDVGVIGGVGGGADGGGSNNTNGADPLERYEKIEMNHNGKAVDTHRLSPILSSVKNTLSDPPDYGESQIVTAESDRPRRYGDDDDGDFPSKTTPSVTDRPTARPSHPTTTVSHRPRLLPDDPKDNKKKTYLECNLGEVTLHHHVLHKESLPAGHLYTTAAGRQNLCNTKNVPDLLDTLLPSKNRRISQTLPRSTFSSNNRRNTIYAPITSESQSPLLLGSRSSGGSNTSRSQLSFDSSISSDHPRQLASGQKSSSYLNLSTTDSVGGNGSSRGHHQQHPSSYYWTPPSLPSSPARERRLPATPVSRGIAGGVGSTAAAAETPILDALSSRHRPYGGGHGHHHNKRNQLTGSNHSLISSPDVTYDYHTAQLDMFLDEYKTLRKELTKMQRTCDTLRLSNASLASSTTALQEVVANHPVNNKQEPQQPSSSVMATNARTTPKSILKNKNQATYVYRAGGNHRRNSYHLLDPAPDDIYLS